MFKNILAIIFIFIVFLFILGKCQGPPTRTEEDDAVEHAYFLCQALQTSFHVIECDIGGWSQTVTAVIDTSSAYARQICQSATQNIAPVFKGEWKLKIVSPYSGNNAIASCALPYKPTKAKSNNKKKSEAEREAFLLCHRLENSYHNIGECVVHAGTKTVNALIWTNSTEAKEICQSSVANVAAVFQKDGKKWRLRISSPSNGDDVLAVCILP